MDYDTNVKNYNNKVMFALKLGYSETLLQKALMKLGHHAEENQVKKLVYARHSGCWKQ